MDKPMASFETPRLMVCAPEETDKELYMSLRVANSKYREIYNTQLGLKEDEWNNVINCSVDIYLAVFLKRRF